MQAAAEYGLAGLCGSSSDVGVVGFTLGGGMGSLGRLHGLAADHVTAVEIVPADGRLRRVTDGLRAGAVLGRAGRQGQLRDRDGAGVRAGPGAPRCSAAASSSPATTPPRCCTGSASGRRPARGGRHLDRDLAHPRPERSCRRRCAGRPPSTCGSPTREPTMPRPSACFADEDRRHDPARLRRPDVDLRDGRHPHGPQGPDAGAGRRGCCCEELHRRGGRRPAGHGGPAAPHPADHGRAPAHGRGAGAPGDRCPTPSPAGAAPTRGGPRARGSRSSPGWRPRSVRASSPRSRPGRRPRR